MDNIDHALIASYEEETEFWVGVDPGCEGEEGVCVVRIREGEITEVIYPRPNGPQPTRVHSDEVALWLEGGRARRLYVALRAKLRQWLWSPRGAYRLPRGWVDKFR